MIEDKIQQAIKPIISIYNQIELEIIEKIAKHFNVNEEFINSDYWYFEKLKELGGLKITRKIYRKDKTRIIKSTERNRYKCNTNRTIKYSNTKRSIVRSTINHK